MKGVRMLHFRRIACIALILLLANLTVLYAQETALPDDQVKERLGFITDALRSGQGRAGTWWYGWIGAYSAGAVAGGVLAATEWNSDRDLAEDMLVDGATFALGVVGLVMDPFVPATAAKKLGRLPETTPDERLAKLRRAEELLRECARCERKGRGWGTHLLNIGANAAAGVVSAAAFNRPWTDGLITFATGEAVSLLNIFTQPMKATRDLKKYEAGYPTSGAAPAPAERPWSLSVWPGGVSIRLQF
jgi:hypothetical protein